MSLRSLTEAIRAPWVKRAGLSSNRDFDFAYDRDYAPRWQNPTSGGPDIIGVGVSPQGRLTLGGPGSLAPQPLLVPAIYTLEPTAAILDQNFYIANQSMAVVSISEIHRVAGGSTPTAVIKKCTSGQTIAQGTSLMTNTFDMAGTAQTQQNATLSTNPATTTLAAGDRLALDLTGTLTSLAGVCVTVWMMPLTSPTIDVTFAWNANAELVDAAFFVAHYRYVVNGVRYSHAVKGTNGSAVNVQLVKDTTTSAPGAGTDLLTNNTNAGFDCKGTINVPQVGTLTATAASLQMAIGDRLSVDFSGTTTALAGVVMTVSLTPIVAGRTEISFFIPSVWAANTDQQFFISNGNYEAVIASEVHAVAAGGTSTMQLTKDSGTDAPGAGTDLLLAAFDLNGTANTVDVDLLAAAPYTTQLKSGDRLAVDFAHAVQASSGLAVTVGLQING